jgi:formylglycine-generating enzyme required for sulfatase activity
MPGVHAGIGGLGLLAIVAFGSAPLANEVLRDCPQCPELVIVPAGRFEMGSTDGEAGREEGPVRQVTIAHPFALGRTEITRGQFEQFVSATGWDVADGCRTYVGGQWIDDDAANWRDNGLDATDPDLPVTCVSWRDAQAYVAWLRELSGRPYRLPSEAEWEYAARAGSPAAWPWGNNPDNGCGEANMYDRSGRSVRDFGWAQADCDDGSSGLAPVASYATNAFGVHDMIGNVWEWTADCYREGYVDVPMDGSAYEPAQCELRSVRGGSWMTRPSRCRASFRGRDPETRRLAYFGFRIARDLSPQEAQGMSIEPTALELRRISLRVDHADSWLGLLRDVLGLSVTRDAPLESARARAALDVPVESTLRFITITAGRESSTELGLLQTVPPGPAQPDEVTAVIVLAVSSLDSLVAAARTAGFEVSDPAPFGAGASRRGREATVTGPDGVRLILQELGP